MYYVVYGFLWLVSLLPLRILYFFGDCIYGIIFYIIKYRRDVVVDNIKNAFPEMSSKDVRKNAKQFYHNFIDTFIETIKLISAGEKFLYKHASCEIDLINELSDTGKNIHIMAGHQFNWEFANLIFSNKAKAPFVGVYMPLSNKTLDKIFFNLRKRYGTVLIAAQDFKNKMHSVFSQQYLLALAADQNPGHPGNAYWMNFMGRPAPFVTGPAKGAVKNNTAIVLVGFTKLKRGYYHFTTKLLAEDGAQSDPTALTVLYKNEIEKIIKADPANYLWSHRRWKYEYKPEYGKFYEG